MKFEHGKNKIQIFKFWPFPEAMGSEVTTIGLKTYNSRSSFFFKRALILFNRGPVEHVLITVNLKLKPSLFTPRPNRYGYLGFLSGLPP